VRADHLEQSVWDDVRGLVADPDRLAREYRRRLKESVSDRNRPSCRVRQLLDGVRRGISRLIDVYQDGLIGKGEFEPRLTRARERQLGLERELAAAMEQERDKDHISEILGEFCAFAKAVEANLKDADLPTRMKILRLLIKQIEVGEEEVCVVYKVGSCPFEQGPVTGHFQNRSRRNGRQVHEPVPHGHMGDIGTPDLVDMGQLPIAEQVRVGPPLGCGAAGPRPGIEPLQAHRGHEPLDPLAIGRLPTADQECRHPPTAVERGLEILLVDQPHQPQVLRRRDGRWEVIGRAVEAEEFAFSANAQMRIVESNKRPLPVNRSGQRFSSTTRLPC
jgi:hypothetical protein